jgi:hypothetical protein
MARRQLGAAPANTTDAATKAYADTKEPAITAGTTAQYWRGDKSWQSFPTLNQNTTGSAATLTTARTINGLASFNGSANISTNNCGWIPSDYGFLSWTMDPAFASGNIGGTAGTLYLVGLKIPTACNITNVILAAAAVGSTLTSGQCFAGLYQGGTLIGSTADQHTAWSGGGSAETYGGFWPMALTGGPYSVSAGMVYVAWFHNGTTSPTWLRGSYYGNPNYGLPSNGYRCATANTGLTTTLPSTLGTQTASPLCFWAAVS